MSSVGLGSQPVMMPNNLPDHWSGKKRWLVADDRLSSRNNRLKLFKTSGNLRIVLEESIEYNTSNE